jgi:hypothetical protein
MTFRSSGLPVLLFSACALGTMGCRSKVATLRDALLEDPGAGAASVVDAPACTDAGCLDPIARKLGARHGFDSNDPDQASAATVALVLARDRRGDLVPDADRWIAALTQARGLGADALRLAVARGMAEMTSRVSKRLEDDAEVTKLVHDLAGVLPGACPTYAMMGGAPIAQLPAGKGPDTSLCVQRDLERKDGPGAKFGSGVWRAAAGIVALWNDEARALRGGLEMADEVVRPVIEKKLAAIEGASAAIEAQIKAKKAVEVGAAGKTAP